VGRQIWHFVVSGVWHQGQPWQLPLDFYLELKVLEMQSFQKAIYSRLFFAELYIATNNLTAEVKLNIK